MSRRTLVRIECVVLALVGLMPALLAAQATGGDVQASQAGAANVADQSAPQASQPLSQSGLLPVFAVDMNFNPSWVDGNDVPTKSAKYSHNGVSDDFQGAWEALKPAGFNAIRFALDLRDSHSAARLANLCIWAKANSVNLIPVLENGATNNAAAAFPAAVVARLRGGDGQQFAAYTQIAYFQVEKSMNIGSLHPKVNSADAQKALLASVDAVRNSELQALQGTGVPATPIMVSASFDYELLQQGAIAGVPLDPAAEQKAQGTLNDFISPLAASANVDAVNVSWFPGSVSSGDEGHFAALLQELQAAFPNKQVVLTTGFSTAFRTADQASQFFTVTLTNLWDFRLSSGGPSSHFQGVIFEQAFQGQKADLAPPAGTSDPSQWNWTEKAPGLAQMWSQGKAPDDLKWWLGKVEANKGLLAVNSGASSGNNYAALPGLQTLQQISTTFAQAAQNITPPAAPASSDQTSTATNASAGTPSAAPATTVPANPTVTDPSLQAGAATFSAPASQVDATASPSAYQQMLSTLVQQVTAQVTNALVTRLTTGSGGGPQGQYSGYAGQNDRGGGFGQNAFATPNPGANSQTYQPSSVAGSQYSGANLTSSQPGSTSAAISQGSTTSIANAAAVSMAPQDVTVDAANVAPGQTVHITAQIHNGSADQDVSGLTVQLIDPANPAASPQNVQSGISVPRSGVTPVQLSWVAGQPGSSASQPSILVLDATGAQLASAPVPAITITRAAGGTSAAGSTTGNSSSSSGNTQAGAGNSTGATPTSTGQSGQMPSDGGTAAVAPQISYFGPANAGGPQSPLSVQVVNPSASLMPAVQAQIYLDGKPGPIVQLGPMLPRQTRSIGFDPAVVGAAKKSVKVVVLAGGASASASVAPALSGATPAARLNPSLSGPAAVRVPVRSGAPLNASSGLVRTPPAAPGPATSPQLLANSATPVRQVGVASAPIPAARPPLANQSATQPTGNTTPVPAVRVIQPTASATSGPATRTVPPLGAAIANQKTGAAQPPSTPAPAPVTRVIQPPAIAPSQNIRTIPPAGAAPASQPTGVTQSSSAAGPAPVTRTTQPPWVQPASNQTARNSPPPGTNLAVQTATTQPSSAAPAPLAGKVSTPWAAPSNRAAPAVTAPGHLDLSIAAGDIRMMPGSQPGQIALTATIRNLGNLSASGATVSFRLLSAGRQLAASAPIAFSIQASGAYQANWTALAPAGQSLQVVVAVTALGDVNPANNQASLSFTAPQPVQARH